MPASCRLLLGCVCAALVLAGPVGAPNAAEATWRVTDTIDIDTVPSWFPVGFCLLTHGDCQYVAYYNAEHEMRVARRRLAGRDWQKAELPSKVGWDSHNSVTMAVDSAGHLHLAGNMHCVPLIYFRTGRRRFRSRVDQRYNAEFHPEQFFMRLPARGSRPAYARSACGAVFR